MRAGISSPDRARPGIRSASKTAAAVSNAGDSAAGNRVVRKPSQPAYRGAGGPNSNVYTQNPRVGQRERSGIRSNYNTNTRREASRGT